jgi:hypothetical protein
MGQGIAAGNGEDLAQDTVASLGHFSQAVQIALVADECQPICPGFEAGQVSGQVAPAADGFLEEPGETRLSV